MPVLGSATVIYKSVGLSVLKEDIRSTESLFKGARSHALEFTAAIAGIGLTMKSFVDTASTFERMKISMDSLMGSVAGGKQATAWIVEFGRTTSLSIEEATKGFIKLKGFGLDPMDGSFKAITDSMAKFGGNAASVSGVITQMGQAWGKGKLQMADMKVMIENGLPVINLLEKALGKNTAEILKMSEAGTIGHAEMQKLFAAMRADSADSAGLMLKTWDVMLSNLGDVWTIFQKDVMATGLFRDMKKSLADLLETIDRMSKTGELRKWANDIGEGMRSAKAAIVPMVEILGVGGGLILGMKAIAVVAPPVVGALKNLGGVLGDYAASGIGFGDTTSKMTSASDVLNKQLWGTSLSARAATGALGVMGIAAGSIFAAFAGFKLGQYLYDEFEFARVWGVHFVSTIQRGFIELQFAGEYMWMAIKNASIAPMKFMLESFGKLTDIATSTMGALGQTEEQAGFAKMSMDIKMAVREMGEWAGSIDDVSNRRKAALKIHDATVDAIYKEAIAGVTWAEQWKGHNDDTAKASKNAAAEIRKNIGQAYQDQALAEEKKKILVALALAEETEKRKAALEKQAADREKHEAKTSKLIDAALKAEFGFLDKREKAIDKAYKETVKEHEAMLKEIAKLEESQIKEFEKTLGDSQKAYEDFLKDKLGVKELSAESLAEIDREYARIFEDVSRGEVDSFDAAMTDILDAKFENIEALKENDALYSAYLREQEAANKDIRLEFYSGAGQFSEEYYASEIERINAYTEKLRSAGVDAVDIEKEKTAQLLELDIKKLESSDRFFDGFRLQLLKAKQDAMTFADVGREVANIFQEGLSDAISQSITSIFEGPDTSAMEAELGNLKKSYADIEEQIRNVDAEIAEAFSDADDAVRETFSSFSGLRGQFDALGLSAMSLGKKTETALAKSPAVLAEMTGGASELQKQIAKINMAAAFGDASKVKAAAKVVLDGYGDIYEAGKDSLAGLMSEWEGYYKKIEGVNDKIAGINLSTEEKIRELRRDTMSDEERWLDERMEYEEQYAAAVNEMNLGNYEYAAELFEKSIGLAEELATSATGDLEGTTATAIELMSQASTGAASALEAYNTQLGTSLTGIESSIGATVTALDGVAETMTGLETSSGEVLTTVGTNAADSIELMSETGSGAVDALELERQALETELANAATKISEMAGNISNASSDMGDVWDTVWSTMLTTLAETITKMVAKMAAEQITTGAIALADWLISAEDGVFDVAPKPGTPQAPGGGFFAMLHPGESVLPAGLTQQFRDAVGWEDAQSTVLGYFGITPEQNTPGIFDTVGDYSASGVALYNAWQAFRDGDNTSGSIALANAFESAFSTYAANAGSKSAANIAGGLGGVAGAIGSGIGAWQSFQNEDYAQGITQSVQTVQQAAAAYEAFTASTINATSTASVTAAENAAAGSVASSIGDTLEGAGWGGMLWSVFNMIVGDEHMQSSLATTGATIGAYIGAAATAGPYSWAGGLIGAAVGGMVGTVVDVAQGPDARFEVDDLNDQINAARTWTPDGWTGNLNPVVGDTGSAHGNARNAYIAATQASMDMATAVVATVNEMFGPEIGEQFSNAFAANIDPVAASGDNWQIGEEGYGASTATRLAATYWNDISDALATAAYAVAPNLGWQEQAGSVSNPLAQLGVWARDSMVPSDILIDPTGQAQQEERAQTTAAWTAEQDRQRISGEIGGAALGGVTLPPNEDGFLPVQQGEGILPIPALKWAEEIGKQIQSGGIFGGSFAEFDRAPEPQQITVTFPEDVGRSDVFSELYLSDVVTNTTGANERMDRLIGLVEQLLGVNQSIAAKPVPHISPDGLVNMVAGPLQDGAQRGRYDFESPQAKLADRYTIQQFQGFFGN